MTTPKAAWTPDPAPADQSAMVAAVVAAIEGDPALAARIHAAADVNGSPLALHHTLGGEATNAAAGNHAHPESSPENLQLVTYEEEFLAARAAGENYSWLSAEAAGAGATQNAVPGDVSRPGVVRLSTGTTATGSAGVRTNSSALLVGAGTLRCDWIVRWATLSTAAEEYIARVGFLDVAGTSPLALPPDAAFFEYVRTGSPNLRIRTVLAGVNTTVISAVPVVAGTWYHLAVVIVAEEDVLRADYYVDSVPVGSISTNVPVGAGAETGSGITITKTVGTTARTMDVDYARLELTSNLIPR